MYKKHGFREFTKQEVNELARKIDEEDLNQSLWFAGINPKTLQFSHERYRFDQEGRELMRGIPFDAKIKLWKGVLEKGGHSGAFDINRASHRKTIEGHLIFDGELPFHLAKKVKEIGTRKPVYWHPR